MIFPHIFSAQSQFGICSTLTGSAETLMTERSEEEAEDFDGNWAMNNEREIATKNAQWRRKSKQSRIALVGSPPPPPHLHQPNLNSQQMSPGLPKSEILPRIFPRIF